MNRHRVVVGSGFGGLTATFLTMKRGQLTITEQQVYARSRIDRFIQPQSNARSVARAPIH